MLTHSFPAAKYSVIVSQAGWMEEGGDGRYKVLISTLIFSLEICTQDIWVTSLLQSSACSFPALQGLEWQACTQMFT